MATICMLVRPRASLPFFFVGCTSVVWGFATDIAVAQQFATTEPPAVISSSQRLAIEQVEDLVSAGELDEAITNLERLFDGGAGRIVQVGSEQRAGTLQVRRYQRFRNWLQLRLAKLLEMQPEVAREYRARMDETAQVVRDDLRVSHNLKLAKAEADRFFASTLGPDFQRLLCDLYLERGWSLAAIASLERSAPWLRHQLGSHLENSEDGVSRVGTDAVPQSQYSGAPRGDVQRKDDLRSTAPAVSTGPRNGGQTDVDSQATIGNDKTRAKSVAEIQARDQGSLPWSRVRRGTNAESQDWKLAAIKARIQADGVLPDEVVATARRLALALHIAPSVTDYESRVAWLETLALILPDDQQADLFELLEEIGTWPRPTRSGKLKVFAENAARAPTDHGVEYRPRFWPNWSRKLEEFTNYGNSVMASKPPVGEMESGVLGYHPVAMDGRLYLHGFTELLAFDLKTGRPWPDVRPPKPLYSTNTSPHAFMPKLYPALGSPRATLSVTQDALYAWSAKTPITAWAYGERTADGSSKSQIVGLDLTREGSLLRGFPVRLSPPEFELADFEGPPLLWGNWLLCPIVERDNVGLRRSVIALDRFSGRLVWRSAVLESGSIPGIDHSNLISHQLLTQAGGMVYYNTNLGSIACLDPTNGELNWLTRYARHAEPQEVAPASNRFRYRDLTPCMVSGGLVYCAPQDCPEIFALDATTGDLVWSTDGSTTSNLIHLLGVTSEAIVASGDHLVWIDRRTGQLLAKFPASSTPGVVNALPEPRGLGRGIISHDEVYWPTASEILVFDAHVPGYETEGFQDAQDRAVRGRLAVTPRMTRRIALGFRGSRGGNLLAHDQWLIHVSPSILSVYENPTQVDSHASHPSGL